MGQERLPRMQKVRGAGRIGSRSGAQKTVEGGSVSDKVVENIEMHEQTISTDSNTPLQLIREKELEISGRVLAAKRQADEVVSKARKEAAEIVGSAELASGETATAREKAIMQQAESEAAAVRTAAEAEAAELRARIDDKRPEAVRLVLDAIQQI